MRKMLAAVTFAASIGVVCCQSAGAVPAAAVTLKEATARSPLRQVQYREYGTRHHVVKCYRDLIIGPYRCHYYRRRWW